MASTSTAGDDSRLDTFDGSDPAAYRLWQRRAKIMLAALPSTISSAKYGARLMKHIKGDAESALEALAVDVLAKEGGDGKKIKFFDEKFLPQTRDLYNRPCFFSMT